MGIPAEQENYADIGEVTLIKSADYQANFWETVRVHPGLGGGDNVVVTLPPTNGMADLGKRVRVLIVDVTGEKFCRVIGYGPANAATIKYLGAKYVKYYKYVFQKYDKYNYFGDLINNQSVINDDPQYNLGLALTMGTPMQSVDFVWDGVASWWATETNALSGLIIGSEINVDDNKTDRREFPVDIYDRGIAGQSPPDETIESALSIFRVVRFTTGDQIWLHEPISNARRNHTIRLTCTIGSTGVSGSPQWELKALGVRGTESISGLTVITKTNQIPVTATAGDLEKLAFTDLEAALTSQDQTPDNVENRASHFLMRLKCIGGSGQPIDLYSAVLSYVPYGYRAELPFEQPVL